MSGFEKNSLNTLNNTPILSTDKNEYTPMNYLNQGYSLDKITELVGKTQEEVLYSIAEEFFSQGLNVKEIAKKLNENKSIIQKLLKKKIK